MKTIENSERQYLYIVKALAILSVVCAHCGNVPEGYSSLNQIASVWLGYCGTMGVPVFYFLSGYFFENNKRNWIDFWKMKGISIILPWIFCATILWFYVVLRKGGISFEGWLKFVLGNGSSFYYLTVLILFYLVMFRIKRIKGVCGICIALSVISVIMTGQGINFINKFFINAYLNPLNWIAYFAAGILMRRYNYMGKFREISRIVLPWILVLYLLAAGIHYMNGWSWTYWSKMAIINITIQMLMCFGLADYIMSKELFTARWVRVGEISYTIYLCHQLLVGGLVVFTNLWDCFLLTILRPFIIVLILYVVLFTVQSFLTKHLYKRKFILMLIGMRVSL